MIDNAQMKKRSNQKIADFLVSGGIAYALPIGLFALCWLNLNSGYWNFSEFGTGLRGTFNAGRAFLPFVMALPGCVFFFLEHNVWDHRTSPVFWLFLYGAWTMGASIFSPQPFIAFYWGTAYLMALTVPVIFFSNRKAASSGIGPECILLIASWILLGTYMFGAYIILGNGIFTEREVLTASQSYGTEFSIRSSGIGRIFGLGGIILFTLWWNRKTLQTFLLLLPAAMSGLVVWRAQSRGAMTAFALSLIFIVLMTRKKISGILIVLLIFTLGIVMVIPDKIQTIEAGLVNHYMRNDQNANELIQMTGRIRAYRAGLQEIQDHPVAGQGFWADRMTIFEHVHNSFLQAAMNGGIPGLVFYLLAWFTGAKLFWEIRSKYGQLNPVQQTLLFPAAGVMFFLLIRSIPETTAASFSIDLLILTPVFYFLHAVSRQVGEKEKHESA